jgi:hypothetical protein
VLSPRRQDQKSSVLPHVLLWLTVQNNTYSEQGSTFGQRFGDQGFAVEVEQVESEDGHLITKVLKLFFFVAYYGENKLEGFLTVGGNKLDYFFMVRKNKIVFAATLSSGLIYNFANRVY